MVRQGVARSWPMTKSPHHPERDSAGQGCRPGRLQERAGFRSASQTFRCFFNLPFRPSTFPRLVFERLFANHGDGHPDLKAQIALGRAWQVSRMACCRPQQQDQGDGDLHCTITGAVPPIPIALEAARERSIQRPRTNGPRSLIRTTTLRPLLRFVTVT